jgi:hypothetical protein
MAELEFSEMVDTKTTAISRLSRGANDRLKALAGTAKITDSTRTKRP